MRCTINLSPLLITLKAVGKKLNDAAQCYSDALKQLSKGRGNIVGRIEELKKMSASTSRQLPKRLIDTDEESNDDALKSIG